jgi:Ribosomal protein L23
MSILKNVFKKDGKKSAPAEARDRQAQSEAAKKAAAAPKHRSGDKGKKQASAKSADTKKTERKADTDVKGKTTNTRVLLHPLVTEKTAVMATHSKYVFAIDPKMNKVEVKKAVRAVYGVNPVAVNIVTMKGKAIRYGRLTGRRKDWKKAIITLPQGQTIEVYEGV